LQSKTQVWRVTLGVCGIDYEAKGDRVRATADQADKLELQAMTKPSQAKWFALAFA
jgi:hypothetical protein